MKKIRFLGGLIFKATAGTSQVSKGIYLQHILRINAFSTSSRRFKFARIGMRLINNFKSSKNAFKNRGQAIRQLAHQKKLH